MKYRDYLNTDHWRNFRRRIYEKRKICQNCGGKDKKLNIHHIVYSRFNETEDEVIVLCQDCHFKLHSKKKWKEKMAKREPLDFTHTKNTEALVFKPDSKIQRTCNRCAKSHDIFYKQYRDGSLHLYIACPTSNPKIVALPFEKNLQIPILYRDKAIKKHILVYPH